MLGESSGGGLAAALSLLARDRQGPRLIAQFLDAPTINDRLNTPSMTTLSDTPLWQSRQLPLQLAPFTCRAPPNQEALMSRSMPPQPAPR